MINLYRYMGNNFGNNLSMYITRKMSGQEVVCPPKGEPIYATIGSILEWIPPNSIVWGTGYMREHSRVPKRAFTIHAVRGKLTRELLIKQGFECPEVYGDPALLCPRYYTPKTIKQYTLGVIPHYIDVDLVDEYRGNPETLIINMRDSVEKVIDDIHSCERILSSSLHGLIAADAYGIPAKWIKLSDRVVGNGFKFRDYFSVRGEVDLDKLMGVCPFKEENS